MAKTDGGWFPDIDDYECPGYWQPCLATDDLVLGFQIWFATVELCQTFIEEHILGKGLLP